MQFETFKNRKDVRDKLLDILSRMNDIGFFGVLAELAVRQAGNVSGENLLEKAAIQRGFSLGYYQCIYDMYHFVDKYIDMTESEKVVTKDFGAINYLLENKDITEEEADELRRTANSNAN